MRILIGLVCVAVLCVAGFADSVETIDGQTLEGQRVVGLPDVITLTDRGVMIDVESDRMLSLETADGSATIVTRTSVELTGTTDLTVSSIALVTDTGEISVPMEQVARILFDRGTDRLRSPSTTAVLTDARQYGGELSSSFPDELTVDGSGIRTTTRVRSMTSIAFGDPTVISTNDGSVSGELMTSLPSWLGLETQFGTYRIPIEMVSEIQLTPRRFTMSSGEVGTNSAGVGFKIWDGLPFIVGNLSLGHFGANCTLGFGSFVASGSIGSVTALWYSGSVQYIILISGMDQFVRPHVSVGIIGMSAIASTVIGSASASLLGFEAGVGIDIPLSSFGVPLTLLAGADWSFLGGVGSIVYEVGIRLDFTL